MHKSHTVYEFFPRVLLGNAEAVEQRLNLLMALPVDEANDVEELVDRVLGSRETRTRFARGALRIAHVDLGERAGVVKVREAILAEKERAFGAESKEAGFALYDLGVLAYDGAISGPRPPSSATSDGARALPRSTSASTVKTRACGGGRRVEWSRERVHGPRRLRQAARRAGARAPIEEREYGSDHT